MTFRILFVFLSVAVLASCVSKPVGDVATFESEAVYPVTLQPQNRGGNWEVKVTSKAQGWLKEQWSNSEKGKGYVGFRVDEAGWVFFHVKNEDVTAGGGPDTDPADWVITGLKLSLNGDTGTFKGSFGGTQDPALKAMFPDVKLDGGVIPVTGEPRPFLALRNLNGVSAKPGDAPYYVYYQVELTSCQDSKLKIETDPVIANGGRR